MAKKKDIKNRKHHFLIFRCTQEEKLILSKTARDYGFTVSTYIRKLLGFNE